MKVEIRKIDSGFKKNKPFAKVQVAYIDTLTQDSDTWHYKNIKNVNDLVNGIKKLIEETK